MTRLLRLSGAEVPSSPFWRRSPGLSVACRRRDAVLALDVLVDPGRLAVRRASGGRGRVAAHRVLAVDTPVWYVLYQGLLGVAKFGIALAMMVGYRRAGLWGAN